jgi:hypothetical protein
LSASNPQTAQRVIAQLSQQARDLGANGRDDVYGYGFISTR